MRVSATLVLAFAALIETAAAAAAQQPVPVVELPQPTIKATDSFGIILSLRELRDGRVLVDDPLRRQIRLLDPDLKTSTIVMDSVDGSAHYYGPRPIPLIPYIGDSTLVPDFQSRTVAVIDGRGRIARALALPTASDVGLLRRGASVDQLGRVVFLGAARLVLPPNAHEGDKPVLSDSAPLLRADLNARRTDTIARIARPVELTRATSPDGSLTLKVYTPDPLRTMDDWAVMSDGSVAIVRGHDYHVDWIRASGDQASTAKLPFDWRQLTDTDKRHIIDSTRGRLSAAIEDGSIMQQAERVDLERNASVAPMAPLGPGRGAAPSGGRGFFGFTLQPRDSTSLEQVADYYPPLRFGAVLADLDDHLWILPTTSKASVHGELVYDVVDTSGALIERVRLPIGRLVAGFGPNGAVYLMSGSAATGFALERTTLPKR